MSHDPPESAGSDPKSATGHIDWICDRFEEGWQAGKPPRIDDYLSLAGTSGVPRRQLLIELVAIDLEYRWRSPRPAGPESDTAPAGQASSSRAPRSEGRFRLRQYVDEFPDLGSLSELPVELIAGEYRALRQAGHRPSRQEYLSEYGRHGSRLEQALTAVDRELEADLARCRAVVKVFSDRQLVYSLPLAEMAEFGRQRAGEPKPICHFDAAGSVRVILAELKETSVARRHVQLRPLASGRVEVANASSGSTVYVESTPLAPGESIETGIPILVSFSNKALRVEAEETAALELVGLGRPTLPPGKSLADRAEITRLAEVVGSEVDESRAEELVRWLEIVVSMFHDATSSHGFLDCAVQGLADTIGVDFAAALLWDGKEWTTEAARVSGEEDRNAQWKPSQTILRRVAEEKQTLRHCPSLESTRAQSLAPVAALVASPILSPDGRVIGVLYGDRREGRESGEWPQITRLEAAVVELLASGAAAGLARLEKEHEAIAARVRFAQFFTPQLAQQLESEPNLLEGRDERVTILFCDVRDFSRFSERLGPARTVAWIRDVMEVLSDSVIANEGVLVDYIGDELMAMWGAPLQCANHAQLACRAALAMIAQPELLNERWRPVLAAPMRVGIGINSGIARVGNVGSKRKFKYGPLGNTVNVASRVQGATKYLRTDVLVTGATAAMLDETFARRRLCRVRVANIAEPVELYELADRLDPCWTNMAEQYEDALREFEDQEFRSATRLLGRILSENPDDGPTLLLLSRAMTALADPTDRFDPVWELPGK